MVFLLTFFGSAIASNPTFLDDGNCGSVTTEFGYGNYEIPVVITGDSYFRAQVGWYKLSPTSTSTVALYINDHESDFDSVSATGNTYSISRSGTYGPGRYFLRINKYAGMNTSNTAIEFCVPDLTEYEIIWETNRFKYWNDQ